MLGEKIPLVRAVHRCRTDSHHRYKGCEETPYPVPDGAFGTRLNEFISLIILS